jgi:hypothetical protein
MSQVFYFSDWSQGIACTGPPTSMYVIDALDVGPPSFVWAQSETIEETCGYSTQVITHGCCMGSYDVEISVAASVMTSAIPIDATPETFIEWTPSTAVGSKYCTATYTSETGYSLTKFLLDDGVCRENWQCDKGVLKVSKSTEECMGADQETIVNSGFSSVLNSTVAFRSTTIDQGNQKKLWLGFYPFSLNIIYVTTGGIAFACVIIAIGMLSSVAGGLYILRQMQLHPNRKAIYLPNLICQLSALAASIVIFKFFFVTQSGDEEFNILNQFSCMLQAIASFLVIFLNIQSLLYIFKNTEYTKFIKGKEYILYGILAFVHIILAWPWYVAYYMFDYVIINQWYANH